MGGRANLILAAGRTVGELEAAVKPHWQLQDAGLELRELPGPGGLELRTSRVFIRESDQKRIPRGLDALTYLVNDISVGQRSTPYSMVTAVDAAGSGFLPAELADDEIALNGWLAEDLGARVGDVVTMRYFVMGERRRLEEKSRQFTVLAVVPMDEPQLNGSWMADFPGLSDQKNCRDWKPGFDMDVTRFRDKDEAYWAEKRGTPKAFVNIAVGQAMWGNRWGNLTAVRYSAGTDKAKLEQQIRSAITPESAGTRFIGLRDQALAATRAPVEFGELFVSFSFFLILAASILTGLLFAFCVEQRQAEAGVLLAMGWTPAVVRRVFLMEGSIVALLGAVGGGFVAVGYTRGVLFALETVWSGAVGTVRFVFEWDWLALGWRYRGGFGSRGVCDALGGATVVFEAGARVAFRVRVGRRGTRSATATDLRSGGHRVRDRRHGACRCDFWAHGFFWSWRAFADCQSVWVSGLAGARKR